MKKLKFGFTLAEVATAMTIVGVIAAMVMPLVTKSIQKHQSGATLGRVIEQITLGNQNIIQFANVRTLNGGYTDTLSMVTKKNLGIGNANTSIITDLASVVPAYWGLNNTQISNDDVKTVKSFSGGNGGNDATRVKDGTKYAFEKFSAGVAIYKNNPSVKNKLEDEVGYFIYIDTNGWDKSPNRAGADVFAFKLLNNGTLVSATGTDAGDYAERVINDGFKITY